MVTICSCAGKIPPSNLNWLQKPPVHVLVACDPKRSVPHRRIDPNWGNNGHLERPKETRKLHFHTIWILSACVCLVLSVCLSVYHAIRSSDRLSIPHPSVCSVVRRMICYSPAMSSAVVFLPASPHWLDVWPICLFVRLSVRLSVCFCWQISNRLKSICITED